MGSSPKTTSLRTRTPPKSKRPPFERRVTRYCVLLVIPGLIVSGALVWLQAWALETKIVLLGAEVLASLLIGAVLHDYIVRPLQTLANVVGALREEDFSFRARMAVPEDALGELSLEINELADLLAQNRTEALEAAALVQRVVEEVEIPIFTFDPAQRLRLVNSAGEKFLQRSSPELLGQTASELGVQDFLTCENETLMSFSFAGGTRWFVRRSAFRREGIPHTLVVLSDVSRALREAERGAWQRLIRVIGHELNNSLTPIKSIAGSLYARLSQTNLGAEERCDFERGLEIIENRAASLNRFLQAYRRLAQMPPPLMAECAISTLVKRVSVLENRVSVEVIPGPEVVLAADPDQIEQMLINLLRNAAEAVLEIDSPTPGSNGSAATSSHSRSPITLTWNVKNKDLVLTIEDSGSGLMNPSNAFVPFYTTKPEGSGIGLILSRQICEAHGGSLELTNRPDQRGCVARVLLPTIMAARENRVAARESHAGQSQV
ncbi:MAG TPA: ATP-binding protein [Candidatus Sulfotelmatobacter sp.]